MGLHHWEEKWTFKIAWDNTQLFGFKSEGLFMQPMNVRSSQSPLHVRELGRYHSSENKTSLSTLIEESRINELLSLITPSSRLFEKPVTFFSCADWPALIYELGGIHANTRFMDHEVCPMCDLTKEEVRFKYLENPIQLFSISKSLNDYPEAMLHSLPLRGRRYCWMHGVSCILSNTLKLLFSTYSPYNRSKSRFLELMKSVYSGWSEENYSLFPSSMKLFFEKRIGVELSECFNTSNMVPFQEAKYLETLTPEKTVETLLDCIRVFKEFAYKPFPLRVDFKCLDIARNTFLKIYALNRWRLEVTTHFILNHGLEFVSEDLTAFHTLNEAIEHHNEVIKKHSHNVFLNGRYNCYGYNRTINLYQRLRINQIFSFITLNQNNARIPKWNTGADIERNNIAPPVNLELYELSPWGKAF